MDVEVVLHGLFSAWKRTPNTSGRHTSAWMSRIGDRIVSITAPESNFVLSDFRKSSARFRGQSLLEGGKGAWGHFGSGGTHSRG